MYKIAILTALYQRLNIAEVALRSFKRLQTYRPETFEIQIFAAVSNRDEHNLCQQYGITTVKIPNHPLGLKWNEGLSVALSYDFDYLMIAGSDDLITPQILDVYEPYLDLTLFGPKEMYAIDLDSGAVKYFTGYKEQEMSLGAGRMISREAIQAVHYKLWRSTMSRGLDSSMIQRFTQFGIGETIISLAGSNASIIDMKTIENLNSFGSLPGQIIPRGALYQRLTPEERADLALLF